MIAGMLAALAAGLFAGAAMYITFVEHPARLTCGVSIALAEFRPSYRRAAVMQAALAITGSIAALTQWWRGGLPGWLVGGLLFGAVVPFTLLVVFPTNRRLLDESLDASTAEATALLHRWGWLHAARTAASVVAFVTFLELLRRQ
jgi:hypothetical protein